MHLVRMHDGERLIGRIVESEAYQGPQDLAAHSSRGKTDRTAVMFGAPGHAYVYLIYGMWDCLNVVTREEGVPHAVLIRAVEPMSDIRGKTWGPGLLCRAMHIDRRLSGTDLCGGSLWIEAPPIAKRSKIERGPRIGVDYAGSWADKPWRFFDRNSPYVSTVSAASRRKALNDFAP
jgi:DNA-3-methyladenine glycosylase